jgi:hypothetical protein
MNENVSKEHSGGVAAESPSPTLVEGYWPVDDVRRIFVEGAKWWEFHSRGGTMWQSDTQIAEEEADKRFPNGTVPPRLNITEQDNEPERDVG